MNGIPAAPLQCDWLLAAGDWHAAVGALSRAGGGARTKTKGRGAAQSWSFNDDGGVFVWGRFSYSVEGTEGVR